MKYEWLQSKQQNVLSSESMKKAKRATDDGDIEKDKLH